MKKFRVFYWRETGNDCIDCEIDIEAVSFDAAYQKFRIMSRLTKIREITEVI